MNETPGVPRKCLPFPVGPKRSWLQVKVHQWISPNETQRMRYFALAWGTNSQKQPSQKFWKTKILWNVWPQPHFLYSVFLRERQWGHSDEWPFQRQLEDKDLPAATDPGRRAGGKQGDLEKDRLKKEKNAFLTKLSRIIPRFLLICSPGSCCSAMSLEGYFPPALLFVPLCCRTPSPSSEAQQALLLSWRARHSQHSTVGWLGRQRWKCHSVVAWKWNPTLVLFLSLIFESKIPSDGRDGYLNRCLQFL